MVERQPLPTQALVVHVEMLDQRLHSSYNIMTNPLEKTMIGMKE